MPINARRRTGMIKYDFWSTQPCDRAPRCKNKDEGTLMLPMTFCGSDPGNIFHKQKSNKVNDCKITK